MTDKAQEAEADMKATVRQTMQRELCKEEQKSNTKEEEDESIVSLARRMIREEVAKEVIASVLEQDEQEQKKQQKSTTGEEKVNEMESLRRERHLVLLNRKLDHLERMLSQLPPPQEAAREERMLEDIKSLGENYVNLILSGSSSPSSTKGLLGSRDGMMDSSMETPIKTATRELLIQPITPETKTTTKPPLETPPPPPPPSLLFGRLLPSLLLLLFTFATLTTTLHTILYQRHILPLMNQVSWYDNHIQPPQPTSRAWNEVTYGERQCGRDDITTRKAADFTLPRKPLHQITTRDVQTATDKVMTHGVAIVPNVLTHNSSHHLRNYILSENAKQTEEDKFPVESPDHRWSILLGAQDHPAVAQGLEEIATHPMIQPLLEQLLGPNPALVELTAITSEYGAAAQGFHSDTWIDASHLLYGRSFLPVYSVFVPLQTTPIQYGATGICPGFHMCHDRDMDACIAAKVYGEAEHPGDAIVMNMQTVHRGSAYVDPRGPHRAVLFASFTSRPQVASGRILPFGPTYATRWDMWGHTLADMAVATKTEWSPLHSLAVKTTMKGSKRNKEVGWNLWLLEAIHFANEEVFQTVPFGEEVAKVWEFMEGYGKKYEVWIWWVYKVVGYVLGIFTGMGVMLAFMRIVWSSLRRKKTTPNTPTLKSRGYLKSIYLRYRFLALSHLLLLLLPASTTLYFFYNPASHQVRSNNYMGPPPGFIPVPTDFPDNYVALDIHSEDVLWGDRLLSKSLYANRYYLSYHPGNRRLREAIKGQLDQANNAFFQEGLMVYKGLQAGAHSVFKRMLLERMVHHVEMGYYKPYNRRKGYRPGRFLMQTKYGDFVLMTEAQKWNFMRRQVLQVVDGGGLVSGLLEELDLLVAGCKYGERGSYGSVHYPKAAMIVSQPWTTVGFVKDLRDEIMHVVDPLDWIQRMEEERDEEFVVGLNKWFQLGRKKKKGSGGLKVQWVHPARDGADKGLVREGAGWQRKGNGMVIVRPYQFPKRSKLMA